ncbi:1095_t:CDS:2, partial [Cetraspora pellucida]
SHKKTLYELVYDDKLYNNCTLVTELYAKNIHNKEEISDTIQIQNKNIINLNDDMEDLLDQPLYNKNIVLNQQDIKLLDQHQQSKLSDQYLEPVNSESFNQCVNLETSIHYNLKFSNQHNLESSS